MPEAFKYLTAHRDSCPPALFSLFAQAEGEVVLHASQAAHSCHIETASGGEILIK